MQRYYQDRDLDISANPEINRRAAFHEAGHAAAAAYLLNKRKNLPEFDFQIQVREPGGAVSPFPAKINRGKRIADSLAPDRKALASLQKSFEPDSHRPAREADIVYYLSGPLAEAKYVALRDDELFTINLLRPNCLVNYGGPADLKEAYLCLESFPLSPLEREARLSALFAEAFRFIQAAENWSRISALANHILAGTGECIGFKRISEFQRQERRHPNIK